MKLTVMLIVMASESCKKLIMLEEQRLVTKCRETEKKVENSIAP